MTHIDSPSVEHSSPIHLSSPFQSITYNDDANHFSNGLLRLMDIDLKAFERWLAIAEEQPDGDLLRRLGTALHQLKPLPGSASVTISVDPVPWGPGYLLHPAISENPGYGIAVSHDMTFGWLVHQRNELWTFESAPSLVDEAYFQAAAHGRYVNYTADEHWRVEKARRQLAKIRETVGVTAGAALDIGSAYGYFRVALEEAGFDHYGVDVSQHAVMIARQRFGFDTILGELTDNVDAWYDRFDLITLWDVLEHTAQPHTLLEAAARCLRPGGTLALRTPNLDCPEADYFGPFYHSFQRPHLIYFTPTNLEKLLGQVGFRVRHIETPSHLLRGFVGCNTTRVWAAARRGSDITLHCIKV